MTIGADRAVSSVGLERHVDIVEVVGSNPIPPTPKPLQVNDLRRSSFVQARLYKILHRSGTSIGVSIGKCVLAVTPEKSKSAT